MSYILEALKKSEKERNQGAVPVLQGPPPAAAGRRPPWAVVGIAGAVLAAAMVGAWYAGLRWPSPSTAPAGETARQGPAAPAAASDPAPAVQAADRPQPTPLPPPADEPQRVAGIEGLSPAARARIEGLTVNVVSYSEQPGRRFVMLDQRIVRESESLGDGVVVKRITPEGAVLGADGQEILVKPE